MTAATLSNNLPALATPFDNGLVNSVIPSPAQLSSGFVPNVDKINAEQQNWLHNAGTTAIFLMQQLGLALPFNPVAGASIVATPAGGIVSVKNNSTGATEFYIAKNNRAIGYTDPSLDPTNWVFFNITALAQFAGFFAAAGGTSDAITASYTVPYPVLVDGFPFTVKIGTPNTTTTPTFAPTINGSVQTARTIVKFVNNAAVALAVGDLTGDARLRYDLAGTRYILDNPVFSNGNPKFSVYSGVGNQAISGLTKVRFDSKTFDTNNNFDAVTNWRFTPTVAGYYQVNYAVTIAANSTTLTSADIYLYKNGVLYKYGSSRPVVTGTTGLTFNGSDLVYMNGSTDYLEIYADGTGTNPVIVGNVSSPQYTYFSGALQI